MIVYVLCHNCRKDIVIRPAAPTKQELAALKGSRFSLTCPACGHTGDYTASGTQARRGSVVKVMAIAMIILAAAMLVLLGLSASRLGGVSLYLVLLVLIIPAVIYWAVYKTQDGRVITYNRSGKKDFGF